MVVEYLLSFGNENFVGWAKENLESIEALQHFSHDDVKATFRGEDIMTRNSFIYHTSLVDM